MILPWPSPAVPSGGSCHPYSTMCSAGLGMIRSNVERLGHACPLKSNAIILFLESAKVNLRQCHDVALAINAETFAAMSKSWDVPMS